MGLLSPVNADSSKEDSPSTIRQSKGGDSPGLILIRSSSSKRFKLTCSSVSSVANFGFNSPKLEMDSAVLVFEYDSNNLPISKKKVKNTTESK
ncbi:hypothetical protein WICPIJ_007610 [Wickerhamomyces pijperi]|uniref:Uncharacterized protein n=1 Tax=Wickerhamomyces pijperi TaxID=599730 RepID=A0A9P8TJ40_WICPI|nr:hypothetical protein WICPIJ_007610 [Wickerhamomyces pijperi]